MLVLYASQTGTASDVADRVSREARRRCLFPIRIRSVDDYDPSLLSTETSPVVIIVSTTGQGAMPDSMPSFWRYFLRKSLPPHTLSSLHIAVCGLGDSSYAEFNFAAKKVYRRFAQLGAHMLVDPVYCDDQHYLGTDGLLDPWLDALWKAVGAPAPLDANDLRFKYIVRRSTDDDVKVDAAGDADVGMAHAGWSRDRPFEATVLENKRVTAPGHFQDVRHFVIDIAGAGITYEPGDALAVIPENRPAVVDEILKILKWTQYENDIIHIEPHPEGTREGREEEDVKEQWKVG